MVDKSIACTAFDVMKQYLIQNATLVGKYDIPMLPPVNIIPKETVDFRESFSRKIKNHRELNVNFYIDDEKFESLYSRCDRYVQHLKCFGSICGLDFSIACGDNGMPRAMNIWQHYRSHAVGIYLHNQGIKVIPSVSICSKDEWDWCFDGLPKRSTLSVCTNGRVRSKAARVEFCEGFYEMCQRLDPLRVVIVGRVPEELQSPVPIINLKSRNQKINEMFQGGE